MVSRQGAAALPKFSDTLTLSQLGGRADYDHPLALPCLDYAPGLSESNN